MGTPGKQRPQVSTDPGVSGDHSPQGLGWVNPVPIHPALPCQYSLMTPCAKVGGLGRAWVGSVPLRSWQKGECLGHVLWISVLSPQSPPP